MLDPSFSHIPTITKRNNRIPAEFASDLSVAYICNGNQSIKSAKHPDTIITRRVVRPKTTPSKNDVLETNMDIANAVEIRLNLSALKETPSIAASPIKIKLARAENNFNNIV